MRENAGVAGARGGAAALPPALANALNAQKGKPSPAASAAARPKVSGAASAKETTVLRAAKKPGVPLSKRVATIMGRIIGAAGTIAQKLRALLGALVVKLGPAAKGAARFFAKPQALVTVACLAVAYVAGALFFSSHYAPRTKVNGMGASFQSVKAVTRAASGKSEGFTTKVVGNGIDLPISGEDIDFAFDAKDYEDAAADEVPSWSWPVALLSSHDIEVRSGVSYDKEKLETLVGNAVEAANKGATQSENATISYSASKDDFVVVDEKEGTAVDLQSTVDTVSRSVSTLQERVELGEDELDRPTVVAGSPQMGQALAQAEERANLAIPLTVGGAEVKRIEPSQIASWLEIDGDYKVTGDLGAITEYARGELSRELDSVGSTRTYTRPDDGKQVTVTGGSYGWSIDGATLAESIVQRIADNSSEPIEIPMQSYGEVFAPGGRDWGNRYIDVDISEQNIRMYDEGGNLVVWEQCVTGDPNLGYDTVEGVYAIYEKESPKLLIGLDYDNNGEPDYENEVAFWMPFWGGYGLHDAQWRGYFGPDAYYYDGSHGCVNLPYETTELLYEITEVGDVVVVHY